MFTADADSMYTNIDTTHAILVIRQWLDDLSPKLHSDFPMAAVKDAMKIVMTNNLFQFGSMYFLQLLGTAMGTSAVCMWATIYFSVHESKTLLPNFGDNLLLYVRYIDNIFGIWIGESNEDWIEFKASTNNFGQLTWSFTELLSLISFLDLTISVRDGVISYCTYQKLMNLYQYISPHSAHPPGLIKVLKKKCNLICYHAYREAVAMDECRFAHTKTHNNWADFLTKVTSGPKRRDLVSKVLYGIYDYPKQ